MTRLLLIGLAGMDWPGFEAATRTGQAPHLASLRANGAATWLTGAPVTDGPAAWASIATGVQPEAHGVWRGEEAWPGGLRATGKASWKAHPVWARLEAAGVTTGSVAWPASRPGAAWAGLHVDDRFPVSTALQAKDWALPLHCVPEPWREVLRERRTHVSEVGGPALAPFIPDAASLGPPGGEAMAVLALAMTQAATIQAAAVWMLQERAPEAVFVHHPWMHQVRLAFEGRREPACAQVIPAAWRFLDSLVGRLMGLAGQGTQVLFVSAGWRSAAGVIAAAGAAAPPPGASILDVAPTVLARFGLEDRALPGRRLFAAGEAAPLEPAPAPAAEPPGKSDRALIYALRQQGYRPPALPGPQWKADGLAELALMMLERDPAGASATAAMALVQVPDHVLALRVKTRAHVAMEEAEPLPALSRALARAAPDRGWAALAQGAFHVIRGEIAEARPWLTRAEQDPDPGTRMTTATLWLAAKRPGDAGRVFAAILAEDPHNVVALIGRAMGAIDRREFLVAEQALQQAMDGDPGRPAIYLQFARTYALTGRRAEAARAASAAVRLGADPAVAAAAQAGRLRT